MINYKKYLISENDTIKDALVKLNSFTTDEGLTLFVVNNLNQLCGSLTDGDIRRGLISNRNLDAKVSHIMNPAFRFFMMNSFSIKHVQAIRSQGIFIVPLIDSNYNIIKIINLLKKQSFIPVDAVIMAGGRGERLLPLTVSTPKSLLMVGDKPIIEHNIDRLNSFGIDNIFISVRYLAEKIRDYFQDGSSKNVSINYVEESVPLGTLGAVTLIEDFAHDHVLIMNSDLLTNIDLENFYCEFIDSGADLMVATVPYQVQIPYAVVEMDHRYQITSFKEKPTYTYYSNAGIYLVKKDLLNIIPNNHFYNATDFIEVLISQNYKVLSYSILDYWLDIGKHEDYKKANEDIKHLKIC